MSDKPTLFVEMSEHQPGVHPDVLDMLDPSEPEDTVAQFSRRFSRASKVRSFRELLQRGFYDRRHRCGPEAALDDCPRDEGGKFSTTSGSGGQPEDWDDHRPKSERKSAPKKPAKKKPKKKSKANRKKPRAVFKGTIEDFRDEWKLWVWDQIEPAYEAAKAKADEVVRLNEELHVNQHPQSEEDRAAWKDTYAAYHAAADVEFTTPWGEKYYSPGGAERALGKMVERRQKLIGAAMLSETSQDSKVLRALEHSDLWDRELRPRSDEVYINSVRSFYARLGSKLKPHDKGSADEKRRFVELVKDIPSEILKSHARCFQWGRKGRASRLLAAHISGREMRNWRSELFKNKKAISHDYETAKERFHETSESIRQEVLTSDVWDEQIEALDKGINDANDIALEIISEHQKRRKGLSANDLSKERKRYLKELGDSERLMEKVRDDRDDLRKKRNGAVHDALTLPEGTSQQVELTFSKGHFSDDKKQMITKAVEKVAGWIPSGRLAYKVRHVNIGPSSGRYKYRSSYSDSDQELRLTPGVTAVTVAHEFGHHIEYGATKTYALKSLGFLMSRMNEDDDGPLYRYGDWYDLDEYGNPDRMRDAFGGKQRGDSQQRAAYAGKLYKTSSYGDDPKATMGSFGFGITATEVISMGVERLFEDPTGFAKSDPEYFRFVIATLRGL